MRYFKYKNTAVTEKNALMAQYNELSKDEKRLVHKGKILNTIGTVVFFAVSSFCIGGCVLLIKKINIPENLFFAILCYIGTAVLGLISIIISFAIGAITASPFWSNKYSDHRVVKRQMLSEAYAHLRDYYELQEPCIVTKCYGSSDKKFINHDVCIFPVGDELRITTNLKHGFFHGEKDLGCYAFKFDEITLSQKQGEGYLIAELKAGDTVFLLGYRAKSFIERNLNANCVQSPNT